MEYRLINAPPLHKAPPKEKEMRYEENFRKGLPALD